jgi:pyruvate/2-oxoglutarate dehydrogenase complex dihydrolipoamide dehydrogenase (E3) component
MPKVTDRIKNIQDSIGRVDKKQRFEELGATVIQGKAHFLDRNRVVIDGQTVSAFKWIIATGSEPRIPPIPGLEDIKYYTSDSIFAIEELPENLVVIGGGPIGIEMAQAFLRLGSKVTIIDAGSHILGVEDEDLVLPVIETLKNEGAEILTNAKTIKVSPQKGAIIVEVEQNERKFEITGTHLLVATGRKPVAESLQPEKAGVEVQRSAIVTNQRMRTSASNIFACGDCNGKFLFTHVASAEAAVAIANALLHIPKTMNYDHVPWCTYTDPEVASIGLNKKRAAAADIEYEILEAAFADVDRAETESETVGFARALIDKKGRLLGAQIVGKHAGELIHSLIPFVVGKKKITQAAANIVIYPCRSDYLKKLQSEYLKKKFFNPTWKARLKTLFGFRG